MEKEKRNENLTKSEEFVKRTMEKLMGEILDMARINGMGSPEQFAQFEKSTKNKFNDLQYFFRKKLTLKEEETKEVQQ